MAAARHSGSRHGEAARRRGETVRDMKTARHGGREAGGWTGGHTLALGCNTNIRVRDTVVFANMLTHASTREHYPVAL